MMTGQIHHRDGERGGEQAGLPFRVRLVRIGDRRRLMRGQHREHERAEAEEAVHDARHAGQAGDGDADDAVQPAFPRIFVEIDRRQHADRRDEDERDEHQIKRADERRPESAVLAFVRRVLPQVIERKDGRGFPENVHEDQQQRHDQHHAKAEHDPLVARASARTLAALERRSAAKGFAGVAWRVRSCHALFAFFTPLMMRSLATLMRAGDDEEHDAEDEEHAVMLVAVDASRPSPRRWSRSSCGRDR